MRALELKVPPLALVLIMGALMWLAGWFAPALAFTLPHKDAITLVLVILGIAIVLAGGIQFQHSKTTLNPMKPESASSLVVSGVYRFTRNPMYLGVLFLLSGWGIFISNLLALAGIPAFVLYMNRFQIGPEERALAALFGKDFVIYKTRVRRWI